MNARTAAFALVSIQPLPLGTIAERLTYSRSTLYQAVEALIAEGLLVKGRHGGAQVIEVAGGYAAQKLREVNVLALKHGVDPELLLRESTRSVWRAVKEPRDLKALTSATGLSQRWVRSIIKHLARAGLVRHIRRRPLVVVRSEGHPLGVALDALEEEGPRVPPVRLVNLGYEDMTWTPEEIERALHRLEGSNIYIRGTGFQVKGGHGPLRVVESVPGAGTCESETVEPGPGAAPARWVAVAMFARKSPPLVGGAPSPALRTSRSESHEALRTLAFITVTSARDCPGGSPSGVLARLTSRPAACSRKHRPVDGRRLP